jgi:Fe-S-cluster formation regulator IscX/YfhJ
VALKGGLLNHRKRGIRREYKRKPPLTPKMKFTDMGNKKVIEFEESDSDHKKRMVEQGLAFIRNLFSELERIEG